MNPIHGGLALIFKMQHLNAAFKRKTSKDHWHLSQTVKYKEGK